MYFSHIYVSDHSMYMLSGGRYTGGGRGGGGISGGKSSGSINEDYHLLEYI